jgi:hypothetical protein
MLLKPHYLKSVATSAIIKNQTSVQAKEKGGGGNNFIRYAIVCSKLKTHFQIIHSTTACLITRSYLLCLYLYDGQARIQRYDGGQDAEILESILVFWLWHSSEELV